MRDQADATLAAAAAAIAKGSKSFAAAARLFDRPTRESAILLYAWCRHCDDVVDGQDHGRHRDGAPQGTSAVTAGDRVADLEERTRAALRAGAQPAEPAFAALAEVVRRTGMPTRYPLLHLEGFRMDVGGRRYLTFADTLDYCYHVAGVVGVMMAQVMGMRDPAVLDRACDLGIAFQLTNIARDLIEDAEHGRVYVPADWLGQAGLPEGEIGAPGRREALAEVAARLVDAAEPYYASARIGISALPARSAWAIATALGIYRQIGLEVKRRGPRAWDRRVSTSTPAKLAHIMAGGATALARRSPETPARDGLWTPPS